MRPIQLERDIGSHMGLLSIIRPRVWLLNEYRLQPDKGVRLNESAPSLC
jgi:hypothetical protein